MISKDHILDITTAPKRDSRHWTAGQVTWEDVIDMMTDVAKTKACGNYVLGRFKKTTVRHPGIDLPCTNLHRTKVAIELRGALTLDVDYPGDDFREKVAALPHASIIHTTYSSTDEEPRYRLIVPLSRTVTPDEYHTAAAALMQQLGEKQFDAGSVQPERYMFKPSESAKGRFWYKVSDGELASVEALLEDFQADLSVIPLPKPNRSKRDPFGIDGTIGAFNRAYDDFGTLIEEYDLPYAEAGADRWHLVGASAAAGMGIVAPGLVHSHHANDPAYGVTCSAFDLARLHMFGDLDEKAKPGTPINKLPSTLAMLDEATKDVRVVTELVGADFVSDMDDVVADATAAASKTNWRLGFSINSRTGVPTDSIGNWDLIAENDDVIPGLYYNELTLAIETERDLPWRKLEKGQEVFDKADEYAFANHIEREYGLRATTQVVERMISEGPRNRRVNPVRDYLESLTWDGKTRIEEALPGVRPTTFTRMAARKSLVAAVARMFEPGIKWDHMLVLFGSEGLGKSFWIERMTKGKWSASLGRIQDKDTLVTMQRSWILTSDEGHSLRKADFDAQKEFLTKTADVFRMPYDREARAYPRRCVIWGTTNDDVFLRRQEGNRRFLIVRCEDKVDFEALTEEYVDQVWAEAVHLYRAGEQLWLTQEESDLAAVEREHFTEEDALAGLIQKYLDTLVPSDWNTTSPEDRQMWLMNSNDGLTAVGTDRIDQVCSIQIWVEAMGRRKGDARRMDLLDINTALKQIPGWVRVGHKWDSQYGTQSSFVRLESLPDHDLI